MWTDSKKSQPASLCVVFIVCVVLTVGCKKATGECVPGEQRACHCASGAKGAHRCAANGKAFTECVCASEDAGVPRPSAEELLRGYGLSPDCKWNGPELEEPCFRNATATFVDLTGDGRDEAFVNYTEVRPGFGSGSEQASCIVFRLSSHKPRVLEALDGSKCTFEGGSLVTHRPEFDDGDPRCCPSKKETRVMAWRGGKLVVQSRNVTSIDGAESAGEDREPDDPYAGLVRRAGESCFRTCARPARRCERACNGDESCIHACFPREVKCRKDCERGLL